MTRVIDSLQVGVITAGLTLLIDPSPPWWLVGVIVAVVLYVNPCQHRR